jgi:hypothetical protein
VYLRKAVYAWRLSMILGEFGFDPRRKGQLLKHVFQRF